MHTAVRRVNCLFAFALCLFLPAAHADLYKCKNAQGAVTFSGTPCAPDATKLTSPAVNSIAPTQQPSGPQTPNAALVGKWRTGGAMTYEFKADGTVRSDEVHNDFSVWRTGRWKLEGNNLVLTFTKIGGSVRDNSFHAVVSNAIEWEEDKQHFTMDRDYYRKVN